MLNNTFDKIYDLYDEACSIYLKDKQVNYLEALIGVTNLLTGLEEVDPDSKNASLKSIIDDLSSFDDLDTLQAVFLLLMTKSFKSSSYKLDLMVPEKLSYLIGYIISQLYKNQYYLKIMDINLQGGNLLFAIANFLNNKELDLYGIEDDPTLVRLAQGYFNLGMIDIIIYYQSKLMMVTEKVDVTLGNLDYLNFKNSKFLSQLPNDSLTYEPYLIIENYLKNLKNDGYFIYLINNDFFFHKEFANFKNILGEEYTLKGLLILPIEMFQEGHIGKSLLIGQRKIITDHQMVVVNIPRMNSEDELIEAIDIINQFINEIKEEEV